MLFISRTCRNNFIRTRITRRANNMDQKNLYWLNTVYGILLAEWAGKP